MNASSLPASSRLLFDELLARPNLRLRVGEHIVDIGALRLASRPDYPRLTGKSVAVLIELVRHSGETVTRDQLLERVWADRVTTPDVLTQAIKELRRAFCDDAKPSQYIETIPRVGYRLLAPVSALAADEPVIVHAAAEFRADNDPEHGIVPEIAPSEPRGRRDRWIVLALIVGVLAVAAFVLSRPKIETASGAWTISNLRSVTSEPGYERRPSISPDGTRIVYSQLDTGASLDRLMMRAIDQTQAQRLTTRADGFEEMAAWSPDGSQIAFERLNRDSCKLYVVAILGGAEREIGECRDYLSNYFDWTPDGKNLITAEGPGRALGSMRLVGWDLATGVKQPLAYQRATDYQDLEAHYSPDGKWIAFRRGLAPYSDLCVMPTAGGAVRQLTRLDSRIRGHAWTPDSRTLVFASNHTGRFALFAVDLETAHVQPLNVAPAQYPSAARTSDTIVYEIPRTTNRLAQFSLGIDKAAPELLAKSTGSDASPELSPLGDRIAFVSDRNGAPQIWLYDYSTLASNAITDFRDAVLLNPQWSEDGTHLLFTVRMTDAARLIEIDLASRRQRVISQVTDNVLSGSYGPEADSYLLTLAASEKHNQLVLLQHAGGGTESRRVLAEGIEHVELDKSLGRVYYTQHAQHGLFAIDLSGGTERLVTTLVEASQTDGWRVVDGKIWFVSPSSWHPTEFVEFDPATGKDRVLGRVDGELLDSRFSVTPSRDRIIIVPIGAEDTDVGAFRLSRAK